MGAFAVFNEYEVPIELGIPGDGTDGIQLFFRVISAFSSQHQFFCQRFQGVADGIGTALCHFLDSGHFLSQILMAFGAGTAQQCLIVQRAEPGMADVSGAVGSGCFTHVAICAGEGIFMDAAFAHVGFKLGVLHLDLADTAAGVGIVGKGRSVDLHVIVILQDCIGGHGSQAGVGQNCCLGRGMEVVLHVALGAGQGCCLHILQLLIQGICQISMGHNQFVALVGMAVVAADRFIDLREHIFELDGIGSVAQLIDLGCKVGSLAAEAVCQAMGTAGGSHILYGVYMAAGAAVELGECHALVNNGNHGIILGVIVNLCIFFVCQVRCVDFGVFLSPVLGGQHGNTGAGFHHLCSADLLHCLGSSFKHSLGGSNRCLGFNRGFLGFLAGAEGHHQQHSQKQHT